MKHNAATFYRHTQRTYADPAAVELYITRIPTTREEGLRPAMKSFLALLPARASVLDVGCGPGGDVGTLRTLGFNATGLDTSPAMVSRAQSHYGDHFLVGDVRSIEPTALGVFDGVLCVALLLHIMRCDVASVIGRLRAVTHFGGPLLLVTKHGERVLWDRQLGESKPRGVVLYTEDELTRLLAEGGFDVRSVFRNSSNRDTATEDWISVVATAS